MTSPATTAATTSQITEQLTLQIVARALDAHLLVKCIAASSAALQSFGLINAQEEVSRVSRAVYDIANGEKDKAVRNDLAFIAWSAAKLLVGEQRRGASA